MPCSHPVALKHTIQDPEASHSPAKFPKHCFDPEPETALKQDPGLATAPRQDPDPTMASNNQDPEPMAVMAPGIPHRVPSTSDPVAVFGAAFPHILEHIFEYALPFKYNCSYCKIHHVTQSQKRDLVNFKEVSPEWEKYLKSKSKLANTSLKWSIRVWDQAANYFKTAAYCRLVCVTKDLNAAVNRQGCPYIYKIWCCLKHMPGAMLVYNGTLSDQCWYYYCAGGDMDKRYKLKNVYQALYPPPDIRNMVDWSGVEDSVR